MRRFGLLLAVALLGVGCADSVTDTVQYGAVEVRAVRRSGQPVPGAAVVLYNGTYIMGQGSTGPDGGYRFEFVPPNVLGEYGAYAEPPAGYLRPEEVIGGPTTASIGGIQLDEGGEEQVSFTYVKRGAGRIVVTVEEPDGDAVEGTRVYLFGPEGDLANATVGATGTVIFDPVSFGNRGVGVVPPPGYLYEPEPGIFVDGILMEEDWSETVSFSLEKCPGTIRGLVLDQDGSPASGVLLNLYTATERVGLQETGNDGVAAFHEVGCQEYGLALSPTPGWEWDEGRGKSFFDGIWMTPGDEKDFTFSVRRRSAEIRIQVVDQGGSPVPDVLVELYTPPGPWAEGSTGADGRISFPDIPVGLEYGVKIFTPAGFAVAEGRGSSYFDGLRPEPNEVILLTFVLTRL